MQGRSLVPALQGERLFGTSRDPAWLYEIDLESGEESLVGDLGEYRKVEALEYAFGDEESRIKIPLEAQDVVPDSWTWACSFQTIDCEGLVFTTKTLDPFGPIVAGAGD